MPQNNHWSAIRRSLWRFVPAPLLHLAFGKQLSGIGNQIAAAGVINAERAVIPGSSHSCYCIELANGTNIFSTLPSPNNVKTTYLARRKLGVAPEYAKVLTDLVTRYIYPHALVPVLTIPVPEPQRGGFHLQHRNLPQESRDFTASQRAFLREQFTPRVGWRVIDIGCYLGHGATRVAQLIGPSGKLLAVEAMPSNAVIASHQLAKNNLNHAKVVNRAIWKKAGEVVQINVTENQANAVASDVITSSSKLDVPTTSIAELTEMLGAAADLVSLTVNGAEVEALDSLEDMVVEQRPRRLLMPGWYSSGTGPRSEILREKLYRFGYDVLVTRHKFVIAWRP